MNILWILFLVATYLKLGKSHQVFGVVACSGENITFSCEANEVGSMRFVVHGNLHFEFFSGDISNQTRIEDPPSLITTNITSLGDQFSNFSVVVQTIASENASLTCHYTAPEGELEQTAFVVLTTTSAPTIASIREETVSSVNITLEEPAEGSECVEDYIIQYEGRSTSRSVSTSGALSVVIEDEEFWQRPNITFTVTAVLKDGSLINGRDYTFTWGDDTSNIPDDDDDDDRDSDHEGARIDVLIVIGGVVAGVLLVVLLVTIIFCCLVKFCPTTKRSGHASLCADLVETGRNEVDEPALPVNLSLTTVKVETGRNEVDEPALPVNLPPTTVKVETGGNEVDEPALPVNLPPTTVKKENVEEVESPSRKEKKDNTPVSEVQSTSYVKETISRM